MRLPYRQRFAIILNEFGTGLAARGKDLRDVIRGANPTLRELDDVIAILAKQNHELERGVTAGDKVLSEWARTRDSTAELIVKANIAATATAERRQDLQRNFELFPEFLRQLTPTMQQIGELANQTIPTLRNLNPVAGDVSDILVALAPFSRAGIPAFKTLGDTADIAGPALGQLGPDDQDPGQLRLGGTRPGAPLQQLLSSVDQTNGFQSFMKLIFNLNMSVNGYDQFGHYLRTALLAGCNSLATKVNLPCTANFIKGASSGASSARASAAAKTPLERILLGDDPGQGPAPVQAPPRPAAERGAEGPAEDLRHGTGQGSGQADRQREAGQAGDPQQHRARLPDGRGRMRRRGTGATAIASNPVLVGVATTLVIVVAVFLAYNANAGLPWVPSYRLTAEVPGAASLVRGNEVRIGGFRAGVVDKITPVQKSDGSVAAKLDLKLETDIKPLPIDSTIIIRPRSSLGLKYVEVTRGTSDRGFPEGGAIPLSAAKVKPVEFDEFFNMFDHPTRIGNQQNLRGFGDAFAGRGEDLNAAIHLFVPLVRDAVPVLSAIADPATQIRSFLRLAGTHRRDRRAGRCAAGRAVGELRADDRGVRERRAAVPPGHDLEGPQGPGDRDRDLPGHPSLARQSGRVLRRAAARVRGAQQFRAGPRCRLPARDSGAEGVGRVQPAPGQVRRSPSKASRPTRSSRSASRT